MIEIEERNMDALNEKGAEEQQVRIAYVGAARPASHDHWSIRSSCFLMGVVLLIIALAYSFVILVQDHVRHNLIVVDPRRTSCMS